MGRRRTPPLLAYRAGMLFTARSCDAPLALHVRDEHTEAHLTYLADNSDRIRAAGPLRDAVAGLR